MPAIPELLSGGFIRDDDEGLFSRDIDGQLVRLDAPTEGDYGKMVTLQIDGQDVTVPLAEPLKDADGNIIVDLQGRTTPRYTTIYDAASTLYVKQPGDEAKIPIPVLCHQPHMNPVAVCRLCVVQIYGQKRGRRAAERKLLPACQHQVKDGMEVFTMNAPGPDGDRVRTTVKVMTEMLAADNLKPVQMQDAAPEVKEELQAFNELGKMAQRCGADPTRFQLAEMSRPRPDAPAMKGRRSFDASSRVFVVDHSACILCERCIRACDEVMENHVIGRTGKGSAAGISFDLNEQMGKSTCVSCGECMISCPTTAITFKSGAQVKINLTRKTEVVPARELVADPLFAGVPPKFLLWQQGLVVRRRFKKGDVICRQGEAGNTAYLLKSGRLNVQVYSKPPGRGVRALLAGKPVFEGVREVPGSIMGEMSCLSGTPRSGTITALEDGEVWELRRNVLDRVMRVPALRERFETEYRERSLDLVLQSSDLFKGIEAAEFRQIVDQLRQRLSFVKVKPGQVLFEQGEPATAMYLIRLGHVRVAVRKYGNEAKTFSAAPGSILGEIGLLALAPKDANKSVEEVEASLMKVLVSKDDSDPAEKLPPGERTATCTALGHLELARLSRSDFLQMVRQFPILRRRLVEQSLSRIQTAAEGNPLLQEFVEQGLYEGRSILTLDTDLCTRCDECTKGCIQQHGTESHGLPVTRLLRDGLRFENFLIATSCRSCSTAHCMVGCPVDSIHRGKHMQIVIEDHCIGCGLCASNCPYGNIFMVPNKKKRIEVPDPVHPGQTLLVAQPKAVTCDLCDAEGEDNAPEPRCVSSCPHDAAHRMTGDALLQSVMKRRERHSKS